MRFLLLGLGVCLAACGTDTFVAPDASASDGGNDAVASDGALEGGQVDAAPPDPHQLGDKVVLWLDAADAKTLGGDGGDIVTAWPDHVNTNLVTKPNIGGALIQCAPGLHARQSALLGKPVVSFCQANLDVQDTSSLQLGNNPFIVEAVVRVESSAAGDNVLITKTSTGQSMQLPGLTVVAPGGSSRASGWLDTSTLATSSSMVSATFQIVGFVRHATDIDVRLSGSAGQPATVASSTDVSAPGANIGVGGYTFDVGMVQHVFDGDLAELIVVSDASATTVGLVESYFKTKYGL